MAKDAATIKPQRNIATYLGYTCMPHGEEGTFHSRVGSSQHQDEQTFVEAKSGADYFVHVSILEQRNTSFIP